MVAMVVTRTRMDTAAAEMASMHLVIWALLRLSLDVPGFWRQVMILGCNRPMSENAEKCNLL